MHTVTGFFTEGNKKKDIFKASTILFVLFTSQENKIYPNVIPASKCKIE